MTTRPLILASNRPASETEDGPRQDFLLLAERLGAELSYPPEESSDWLRRLEKVTALDLRQAWRAARRTDISVYVSLSEKVGIPLALFLGRRKVPHVLIAHRLTSAPKRRLQRLLPYLSRFSRIVVLCRAQEAYLRQVPGFPTNRIRFLYDKVDHHFWKPGSAPVSATPLVVSVGRERRDYEILADAARRMPEAQFVVVASSLWARQGHDTSRSAPKNLTFRRGLSWCELRELYAKATIIVVPLQSGTDYAAGVNAVLEAMAMGKPLVVTQTPGIVDYINDGETCRVVPAGNADALTTILRDILSDPARSAVLGANARRVIEDGRNLDTYLDALVQAVR